jgi:hypothetical protein
MHWCIIKRSLYGSTSPIRLNIAYSYSWRERKLKYVFSKMAAKFQYTTILNPFNAHWSLLYNTCKQGCKKCCYRQQIKYSSIFTATIENVFTDWLFLIVSEQKTNFYAFCVSFRFTYYQF